MKTAILSSICFGALSALASAQAPTYINFIRQVQFPTGIQWDASVDVAGQALSQLAIDPGGARFEFWTVSSQGPTSILLDSTYVGTYIPLAEVSISTEDATYDIPRTRADRPFTVSINIRGLLWGLLFPEAAQKVQFLHHVQSYGVKGAGVGIDRTQAILNSQSKLVTNGVQTVNYSLNSIPASNRLKVRGEEKFSVFSYADYQAPASQLASQSVVIWPVADGVITGVVANERLRFAMPKLTITLNDLYPNTTYYVQAYKGEPLLGSTGKILVGESFAHSEPQDRVLLLDGYDSAFDSDGIWTIEVITQTPFGIERLCYVPVVVDRSITINGSFTTLE